MTRTIATKVMWIGKATVFTIGLAVTLALMFGVATTALAAVPGNPFKLGKVNAVDAASTLVGSVNGAMLGIQNQSPGSRGASAPALSLKVAPNNPPLTANPEAGTATGLSADELDGKDSAAFLGVNAKAKNAVNADFATFAGDAQNAQVAQNAQFAGDANNLDGKDSAAFALGTNGKAKDADKLDGKDSTSFASGTNGVANNADKLDGKDSTAFIPTKIYEVQGREPGSGGNSFAPRFATCDPGDLALSGGGFSLDTSGDTLVSSFQSDTNQWLAIYRDGGASGVDIGAKAYCADLPPLR